MSLFTMLYTSLLFIYILLTLKKEERKTLTYPKTDYLASINPYLHKQVIQ
jgi:hypothetical protein